MSRSVNKIRDSRGLMREVGIKGRRAASVDMYSRGSYVSERKRASSEERKSGSNLVCLRWSNSRKSSLNLGEGKQIIKDTRPLNDKTYQKTKIIQLVEFLKQIGFNYPISESKLMSPSKKDFEKIFQFLYCCWDPGYEVHRLEEEAPKILKYLCYPFTINKSTFQYVARTNWPTLLGILIWLMDLYKFSVNLDMDLLYESGGGKSEDHAIMLRYICSCYYSGHDNEEEQNAVFTNMIKATMKDVEELQRQNDAKKVLIEDVAKEMVEIETLKERSMLLDSDISNYQEFFIKMKHHMEKKQNVCKTLSEELKKKETELNSLQMTIKEKQDAYDAQGFDGKTQLNFFQTQKKELMENIEKKHAKFKELQNMCWELEMQQTQTLDKVTSVNDSIKELYGSIIETANNALIPLQNMNIPQVRKLYNNFQSELPDCNAFQAQQNSVIWNNDCKVVLQKITEKVKTVNEILESLSSTQKEKLQEVFMKKSELSAQLKLASAQETQKKNEISLKEKQTMAELTELEAQCEEQRRNVEDLRSKRLHAENLRDRISEESNTLRNIRKQKQKELDEYLKEMQELMLHYSSLEELIQRKCEEYGAEIAEHVEELYKLNELL